MNFYQHHIGDYDSHTAHLNWLEDMAYSRLMRLYYRTEKPITSSIPDACRLVRAISKQEKQAVEQVLNEFFILNEQGWTHSRCEKEISKAAAKADRNREVGKLGGRPRKTETQTEPTDNPDGFQTETQTEPTDNPAHINQTPDSRLQRKAKSKTIAPASQSLAIFPPNISIQVQQDFLAIRKAKKSPLTQTALDGIAKEADKAGISLQTALETCCARGWQGFESAWLQNKQGAPPQNSKQAARDSYAEQAAAAREKENGNCTERDITSQAERVA